MYIYDFDIKIEKVIILRLGFMEVFR